MLPSVVPSLATDLAVSVSWYLSKWKNRKVKRINRSNISPKLNGANNSIYQGLMSHFLDTLEPGFSMMSLQDAAQPGE